MTAYGEMNSIKAVSDVFILNNILQRFSNCNGNFVLTGQ
jgi:hypothetical protein